MPESVTVPRRFNGPLESGNGGYSVGLVASFLGGTAEVTLRRPVPLDTPLDLVRDSDGSARVLHDGELVIESRSVSEVEAELPAPVSASEARAAMARYRGRPDGLFSRCFVCGLAREDAFGVFAGAVEGRELVASPWTPPEWTADSAGHVLPEFVWAVLDCPTYFALHIDGELSMSVLARITARIESPAIAEREHVVIAWPIGGDGRKGHAGAAVLAPDGRLVAIARALMIEPRGA